MTDKKAFILKLAASLALTYAAAVVGGLFTGPAIPVWYAGLEKPSFNPPAWVFGPVWTILYGMMSFSLFLVWKQESGSPGRRTALIIYFIHLVLNVTWTIIFFGLKMPGIALTELILLWISIMATIIAFWRMTRLASLLLVPYLLWVSFATVLNYAIWQLNR
jgi:benzodiazapine receptor